MQEVTPIIFQINIYNKRNIFHIPIDDLNDILNVLSSSPKNIDIIANFLDKTLIDSFSQVICKNTCDFLILDLCDSRFTPNKLEQILGFLNTSLLKIHESNILKSICLIVEKSKKIKDIYFLNNLKEFCEKKNIALIVADDSTGKSTFIVNGSFQKSLQIPDIKSETKDVKKDFETIGEQILLKKNIETIVEQNLQILFGHFLIDKKYHTQAIFSIRKIIDNEDFINQFIDLCESKLELKEYYILPVGLPFNNNDLSLDNFGIRQLAIYLAKSNNDRIIYDLTQKDYSNKTVLILCDVLSPHNNINQIINELNLKRPKKIFLIGLIRFANFIEPDSIDTTSILTLNFSAIENESECKFCQQGVKKIEGITFNEFGKQLMDFDAFTFWEFIKLNSAFYSAGHEIMRKTTGYHYNFRILAKPIFQSYGFYLAYRFVNKIKNQGIKLNLIDAIVCPKDSDPIAGIMAEHIQEIIHQDRQGGCKIKIIETPRNIFQTVTPTELGPLATEFFSSENDYGTDVLDNKLAIILDQAAHRLFTLSSLKYICLNFKNCRVLATGLFINRTNPQNFIEDEKWGHFISLYNWPNQPFDSKNCFCNNGHN